MKDSTKAILKNTGKGVLTMASIPLGLASFFKNKNERRSMLLLGALVNIAFSYTLSLSYDEDVPLVYDNPAMQVNLGRNDFSLGQAAKSIISLPLFLFTEVHSETHLQADSNTSYSVVGKDVIQYIPEKEQYRFNVSPETRFRNAEGKLTSLIEQSNRINDAIAKKAKLESNGDLIGAKKADEGVQEAFRSYEATAQYLDEITTAYTNVASKMTLELAKSREQTSEYLARLPGAKK